MVWTNHKGDSTLRLDKSSTLWLQGPQMSLYRTSSMMVNLSSKKSCRTPTGVSSNSSSNCYINNKCNNNNIRETVLSALLLSSNNSNLFRSPVGKTYISSSNSRWASHRWCNTTNKTVFIWTTACKCKQRHFTSRKMEQDKWWLTQSTIICKSLIQDICTRTTPSSSRNSKGRRCISNRIRLLNVLRVP